MVGARSIDTFANTGQNTLLQTAANSGLQFWAKPDIHPPTHTPQIVLSILVGSSLPTCLSPRALPHPPPPWLVSHLFMFVTGEINPLQRRGRWEERRICPGEAWLCTLACPPSTGGVGRTGGGESLRLRAEDV